MPEARVAAILTAAGRSQRMGSPKALLDWLGKPLIRHQIEVLLAAGMEPIVVVLGHEADRLAAQVPAHPAVRVVVNAQYDEGRSSSVRCGIAALGAPPTAVLITAIDHPLEADPLRALLAAFDPETWAMAQPQANEKPAHPVIFSSRLLDELAAIAEESAGLRAVVERWKHARLLVPVRGLAVGLDLNTSEQYQDAVREIRRHSNEIGQMKVE